MGRKTFKDCESNSVVAVVVVEFVNFETRNVLKEGQELNA